jgi:hypothetical protein
VTALRGVEQLRPVPGGEAQVLPTDVAARQHVNENEAFRFALVPGRYVIMAAYDDSGGMQTFLDVDLQPGATLHRNLPDVCK